MDVLVVLDCLVIKLDRVIEDLGKSARRFSGGVFCRGRRLLWTVVLVEWCFFVAVVTGSE